MKAEQSASIDGIAGHISMARKSARPCVEMRSNPDDKAVRLSELKLSEVNERIRSRGANTYDQTSKRAAE